MRSNNNLTLEPNLLRTAVRTLAWIGLTLLPLAAAGCGHHSTAAEETKHVVEVGTTSPLRKNLTREVQQPGYLRPYEQTPIYTKIAGFAEEPKYDIGDHVKKGKLLVKLFVPEVIQDLKVKAAKVRQAKADLTAAKQFALAAKANEQAAVADIDARLASIRSAEAEVKRWDAEEVRSRKLFEDKVYDRQTLDEVRNQYHSSQALRDEAIAKLESAKAKLKQATAYYNKAEADVEVAVASLGVAEAAYDQWKDWLDYAQITAPYDGVVTLRNVHTGHFLQPSNSGSTSKAAEPLFVMMRTDIMRCVVEVPELDAVLIKDGDKAIIQFDAMPGIEFEEKVKRNSEALDDRTRTLRVEVWMDNPNNLLKPFMYAHVTILGKVDNAWALPPEAVMNDILANSNRSYCFVVEKEKEKEAAHKMFLQIGARCAGGVQILRKQREGQKTWQAITGNEVVITSNNKALQEGQEVHIKAP